MNLKEIKEILLTIDKTNLTYVNLKEKDFALEVSKSQNTKDEILLTDSITNKSDFVETINSIAVSDDIHLIKTPIMGTYYESPSPESSSFVRVGDKVNKGDTLCIIEAMKLMNEIHSDVDGEIVEVLLKNEDLVEYNQPLFKIKTI
ncbi:acetyl-CoA carboxylase biotin carboxyl carrier protein [[Eubacterium] tenue]|uniref:Biotin carboxyl carrier protein of acetyl-CoA carboxylase n=1 Tax=Paeniclostridium hominis TaxID=2764329 RepID=A0ABR7K2S5_9FIRM|nr:MULTISPECIES: acetyl-CoA carboxylase biotin carboxyl carrier protein [Paeniclostridium]MBC6003154.1 acetyl-CoA carboxylase biotin carboxyl carrier protein [Paeniclostridium hominis]MBC8630628.1 acetyl-CoA carboxylase biotin carboxyl carrier protein [[Eubacterium] tenue]